MARLVASVALLVAVAGVGACATAGGTAAPPTSEAGPTRTTRPAVAAEGTGRAADLRRQQLVAATVMSMNGGVAPSDEDIGCVRSGLAPAELDAITGTGRNGPDVSSLRSVFRAIFACRPAGVARRLAAGMNRNGSMGPLTADQKECLSAGFMSLMASDPSAMDAFMAADANTAAIVGPAKLHVQRAMAPTVQRCIPDPQARSRVLAGILE